MHRKLGVAVAVTLVAAALAATAALAARSGSSATEAHKAFPTEPVNLTMWWWGEQEAAGAKSWLSQTIALYEKKHPNVKIKTVLQTTDGLVPAFKAAAAAKKGPDIQYFWGGIWSLDDAWLGNTKAVSDYIPKSELAHYLNAKEDTYDGKVWTAPWYVQPSFPVLYRKDVLAKRGVAVPTTWSALLEGVRQAQRQGDHAIAGGIKDGWFGGWLFSIIGAQGITSISDVLDATTGKAKFTDPKLAAFWSRLQELRDHKCWNDDINSLELYQGQQRGPRESGDDGRGRLGREEVRQAGGRRQGRRDADAEMGQRARTRASSARRRRPWASPPGRSTPKSRPTSSCSCTRRRGRQHGSRRPVPSRPTIGSTRR